MRKLLRRLLQLGRTRLLVTGIVKPTGTPAPKETRAFGTPSTRKGNRSNGSKNHY